MVQAFVILFEKLHHNFSQCHWTCMGLSIRDLDLLSIGLINDMYVESRNDEYKYATVATQRDYDLF